MEDPAEIKANESNFQDKSKTKKMKKTKDKTRISARYSLEEDESIVDYLVQHDSFKRSGGEAIWIEMEELGVCPGRSWQSLKERFRKRISPHLEEFDVKNRVQKWKMRKGSYKEGKRPFDREESKAIVEYIRHFNLFPKIKGDSMWKDMENGELLPGRSWLSMKNHFRYMIAPRLYKYRMCARDYKRFDLGLTYGLRARLHENENEFLALCPNTSYNEKGSCIGCRDFRKELLARVKAAKREAKMSQA